MYTLYLHASIFTFACWQIINMHINVYAYGHVCAHWSVCTYILSLCSYMDCILMYRCAYFLWICVVVFFYVWAGLCGNFGICSELWMLCMVTAVAILISLFIHASCCTVVPPMFICLDQDILSLFNPTTGVDSPNFT